MAETNATISAQAKELKEGQSLAKVRRVSLEGLDAKAVSRKLASMRNSMNQISSRAREATDRDFRVESGQFITHDGTAVFLVCTLTCMEDEGEYDI